MSPGRILYRQKHHYFTEKDTLGRQYKKINIFSKVIDKAKFMLYNENVLNWYIFKAKIKNVVLHNTGKPQTKRKARLK